LRWEPESFAFFQVGVYLRRLADMSAQSFPTSEQRAIHTCGLGPDCVDASEAAANGRKSLTSDGLVEPKTRSPQLCAA
jgi:hypothetical protein